MRTDSDQKVVDDGRKNALKDVEVPLKERSNQALLKKLEDLGEGYNTVEIWNAANARRADWLGRQSKLLDEYDEFLEPIYRPTQSWSSTLHLPITLTVAKTFHARMYAALMSIDPPFTVKARQAANEDRSRLIQELMRYTLSSWINNYKGIDEVMDRWIWNWVVAGSSILKLRWDARYTRYIDVVKRKKLLSVIRLPDPNTGELVDFPQEKEEEVEEEVTKEIFNGPMMEFVPIEEIVFNGGDGDPDEADDVIQSCFMPASDLWTLSDRQIFRESSVERVIKAGETLVSGEPANYVKIRKADNAGTGAVDVPWDHKKYQILERYAKIDVDGSGITADVILWVHKETSEILRATYLRRVNPEGLRPYVKIDFHKRHGEEYGVGIPELLYSITKEMDAMHNMKIDFGLISSMPIGFYRPTSNFSDSRIPMEPGMLIPLDNPQTDVNFPQMGNRTSFTAQEEQSLQLQIERLTSISDMSLGIIGGQGAARTATGARALLGESNANLDVFLRRMNRGWKRALIYLFHMLQEKLPPGFQFRILGDDGSNYWGQVKSKEELCGMYDFELEPNSANSNKQVQIEQAANVVQTIANPLYIQLGMVSSLNLYEAVKNLFLAQGIRDVSRFLTKPMGQARIYTPEEIANATLSGVDIPLTPDQDLQGFVNYFDYIVQHDELLGQFREDQVIALKKKEQQAQAMLDAVNAQKAQVANAQQIQMNAALTTPVSQNVNPIPTPTAVGDAAGGGQ